MPVCTHVPVHVPVTPLSNVAMTNLAEATVDNVPSMRAMIPLH